MQKSRITYLTVVFTIFIVGFVIYTSLGMMWNETFSNETTGLEPQNPYSTGLMGGYLLGGMATGVALFVKFIKNKPLWVKILSAALFFVTIAIFETIGIFMFIPYYIYNLIQAIRHFRNSE